MTASQPEPTDAPSAESILEALMAKHAFGPAFFLGQLAAFVRDRCPDPDQQLPQVELHLRDGSAIDVCHVMGVAPHWAAFAARDPESDGMTTVLVAYELIVRIEIRAAERRDHRMGFSQGSAPSVLRATGMSAEELLRAAGGQPEAKTRFGPE